MQIPRSVKYRELILIKESILERWTKFKMEMKKHEKPQL